MDFKKVTSYFKFSKAERKGIALLLLLILVLQLGYYFVDFNSFAKDSPDKLHWLALQAELDSVKEASLKAEKKVYPFNPNFITDYKGYTLGMSVVEIDRLHAYRKKGKYVNSPQEFQTITKISDSLLQTISPYFKFPDWVRNKKANTGYVYYEKKPLVKKEKKVLIDINKATHEDLVKIYGIGEGISLRILKFKESLGGFVSMEQMNDVWGLSPEVIQRLNDNFKIASPPEVKKIDINNASLKEIAEFPYFKYTLAKEIVRYRSMNGEIKNATDLTKIKGLSIEKANIIALYLAF
jgi:DNA uptake protein ComE-like DNA-binding protein